MVFSLFLFVFLYLPLCGYCNRDLKELYFTVLTQFSLAQLQSQLAGLQTLLAVSTSHKAALLRKEKTRRRVAASLAHRTAAYDDPNNFTSPETNAEPSAQATVSAVSEGPVGGVRTTECGAAENLGKQRRRTLRKQVERLELLIRRLSGPQNWHGNELHGTDEDGTAAVEDSRVDISCNPKTRGGWGFWKS